MFEGHRITSFNHKIDPFDHIITPFDHLQSPAATYDTFTPSVTSAPFDPFSVFETFERNHFFGQNQPL